MNARYGATLKRASLWTALLLLALGLGADGKQVHAESTQDRGLAIAKLMDKANDGYQGEVSESELILINAHGDRTVRRIKSRLIEVGDDGDRSLIEFDWPADVRGTRMLTWSHRVEDDDQWLYLPAVRQVKRIASRNQSSSFMGSEFSYEDLAGQEPEKFNFNFLDEQTIDGRKVYRLERFAKSSRSGYSKQVMWVDAQHLGATKVEFYDRKGELLKTASFENYQRFGRWWRPERVVMKNHQTQKESQLIWKTRKVQVALVAGDFESSQLKD